MQTKYIVAPIWKTGGYFFPLLYLLCDEVLLPWNLYVRHKHDKGPPGPPQIWK